MKLDVELAVNHEPQENSSSFSKMLPRCGRVAHICGANQILQFVFPAAIALLKLSNSQFDCLCETSYKFRQGNGAIAARW